MSDSEGCLFYSIELEGLKTAAYSVITEVYDAQERLVAQAKGLTGEIRVTNPNLWWPRGMNKSVGYLYTLKVENKMPVSQKWFAFLKCFSFFQPPQKDSAVERCQKHGGWRLPTSIRHSLRRMEFNRCLYQWQKPLFERIRTTRRRNRELKWFRSSQNVFG